MPRDDSGEDDNYEKDIISKLDEVSLDTNKVGWYQISYSNDFLSGSSLEAHIEYQRGLWYAIYLVYDILEAERGSKNPFKVYRLNPKFLDKILKDNLKIN